MLLEPYPRQVPFVNKPLESRRSARVLTLVLPRLSLRLTQASDMDGVASDGGGACHWNHECLSVRMAVAVAMHHSSGKRVVAAAEIAVCFHRICSAISSDRVCGCRSRLELAVPPVLIKYVVPAPAVAHDVPAPVIEYMAPAPAVFLAAPAPVIENGAPAPAVI